MATAIGDLVARLRMDTTGFNRSAKGSTRVLGSLNRMVGGLGVTLGAAGIATSFMRMGRAANDFAGAMNRSLAIMTGVNAAMRKDMERTAFSVAASTQFSANQAAEAYFFLASASMDAEQSIAALPAVARFAQAGNFDLALATDLATDAQSALGMKSKDTAANLENLIRVTDVLVKANTVANASVQQFSEAITNKAGGAMRMFNIEMEQGIGVIAAFADQGVKGADAGTKYSIVLRDMTTKAILNKKAFADLNLEVFDSQGKFRGVSQVIGDLEPIMARMSDETKKLTLMTLGFTDKSIQATQALLGYSTFMQNVEEQTRAAGGTVKDVSENVLTDFDEAWNKVTASMSKASSEGFTPILDQLATMIDRLTTTNGMIGEQESRWTKAGKGIASYMSIVDKLAEVEAIPRKLVLYELGTMFGARKGTVKEAVADASRWYADFIGDPALATARAFGGGPDVKQRSIRQAAMLGGDRMALGGPTDEAKAMLAAAEQQAKDAKAFMAAIPSKFDLGPMTRGMPMWMSQMLMGMQQGTEKLIKSDEFRKLTSLDISKQAGPRFAGPRFAGAMERGSAEAFSTIVQAGKGGEKIGKEQLKVQKQLLTVNKQILAKQDPQLVSIPVG